MHALLLAGLAVFASAQTGASEQDALAAVASLQRSHLAAKRISVKGPCFDGSCYETKVQPTTVISTDRGPVRIVAPGRPREEPTRLPAPPPGLETPSVAALVAAGKLPADFLRYSAERGRALAHASAVFGQHPFEECLYAVKETLRRAGLPIDGIAGSRAYDFARHLAPKVLDRLHLFLVPAADLRRVSTLPPGALIFYPPGVCRSDPRSGHVELVTQQGVPEAGVPTIAESDFPHKVNFACVRQARVYIPVN